jgi:hypothetical protein
MSSILQAPRSANGRHLDHEPPEDRLALEILPLNDLVKAHPNLRPPRIEGLLRTGESMNIIAPPKFHKSFFTYHLAFSAAAGLVWLDTFQCAKSRVLLVDNELHRETLAFRLPKVAAALGIDLATINDRVHVAPLRGNLRDLNSIAFSLGNLPRGHFDLIIFDAWYRLQPPGHDENSNAQTAALYNTVDALAERIGAAFVCVHHSTKGVQAGKAVADVGAGAGAQSRAADTHGILRLHEQDGAVVFEAVTRSWAPVKPICLTWEFPLFRLAPDLDPNALRQDRRRSRSPKAPKEPKPVWTAERFAATFGKAEPQAKSALLEAANLAGLSDRKAAKLLASALDQALLHESSERQKGAHKKRVLISTEKPKKTRENTTKQAKNSKNARARTLPPHPPAGVNAAGAVDCVRALDAAESKTTLTSDLP